jgi:hypothetical protein
MQGARRARSCEGKDPDFEENLDPEPDTATDTEVEEDDED